MSTSSQGFGGGFGYSLGNDGFGSGFQGPPNVGGGGGGGGGPPPWSPTDLGVGLQLWLDAQDTSTLFTDYTESTNSVSGANVGRWKDKSGNGRHADKSNIGVNHPVRNNTGINGHVAVDFDTGLTVPGLAAPWAINNPGATSIAGGTKFEVWAVYTSSTATAYVVTNDDGSFSEYWTVWTNPTAGAFVAGHHMYVKVPGATSDAGYSTALGPATIVRAVVDTTLSSGCTSIVVNGSAGANTPGYDSGLGSTSVQTRPIFIGADIAGLYPNKGAFGELIYVSRLLTPSEAIQLNDYLTGRWS